MAQLRANSEEWIAWDPLTLVPDCPPRAVRQWFDDRPKVRAGLPVAQALPLPSPRPRQHCRSYADALDYASGGPRTAPARCCETPVVTPVTARDADSAV